MKKMCLILWAFCLGVLIASAQQPTVTISVQSNGNGIIRVGGSYTNADFISIDCVNKTDGTDIRNQNCVVSGGRWYYDKPVVVGKIYKFAVKASNRNGGEKWEIFDDIRANATPQPGPIPSLGARPGKSNPKTETRYVVHDTYEYASFVDGNKKVQTGSSGWSLGIGGSISETGPSAAIQFQYSNNRDYIAGIQYFPTRTTENIIVNYFSREEFGDNMSILGNTYPTEKGSGDNRRVIIGDGAHYYYILARYLGNEPRQNIRTQSTNTQPINQQQQKTQVQSYNTPTNQQQPQTYNSQVQQLSQVKPRITSPSDRSSSVVGSQLNVAVSGNNIEVIYAGLTGYPNPSNENESNFYKGTMYSTGGNRFFFTPNTSSWADRWVKIIAYDKNTNLWSDPVYVQIQQQPPTARQGSISAPTVQQQQQNNNTSQSNLQPQMGSNTLSEEQRNFITRRQTGNSNQQQPQTNNTSNVPAQTVTTNGNGLTPIGQQGRVYPNGATTQTQTAQQGRANPNSSNTQTRQQQQPGYTNQQQPQTYNTSNFVRTGSAVLRNINGRNYIGDINTTNGFRVSVNSNNTATVRLSMVYRSDNRGGRLIVNGAVQNISFPSTNWNWGTREVQVQLRQGANTIEFLGGYQTDYAPDIAEITIR